MTGGVRSYSYSSAGAFDVQIYTDSSKTELLATSFVSYVKPEKRALTGWRDPMGSVSPRSTSSRFLKKEHLRDRYTVE